MLSSPTQAVKDSLQTSKANSSDTAAHNDALNASAPEFVPKAVASSTFQQQRGRGNKGDRGRGQHPNYNTGGLSRALHDGPNRGHQPSQPANGAQQSNHSGQGSGPHHTQRPSRQQQQQRRSKQDHNAAHTAQPGQAGTQIRQQQQQQLRAQHGQQFSTPQRELSFPHGGFEGSSPDRDHVDVNRTGLASKGRHMLANHLLNFQYDSRNSRGGRGGGRGAGAGRGSPAARRRPAPARPQRYDKQKFLQANFRFLVSSSVDTRKFESDADRMFDWEDVILVDMISATPVQCPISLESPPQCPQITPCGHVYSFGSIMQHLMTHGGEQLRRSAPCPLCYQPIVARELRLVQVREVQAPTVGSTVVFQLLKRPKDSIIPQPVEQGNNADNTTAGVSSNSDAAAVSSPTVVGNSSSDQSATPSKWDKQAAAAAADGRSSSSNGLVPNSTYTLPGATPLSGNPFVKFATVTDPRPLWRAAAQQLGQQLAIVMSQGGLEADLEAPGLFAAANALAQRAKRFAEHQATYLQQQGVPGQNAGLASMGHAISPPIVSAVAAGAGSALAAEAIYGLASGWPVWLKQDSQEAGKDAEQLVRDAFTLAVDGSKDALTVAERQQQVLQQFPALGGGPAAGGSSSRSTALQSAQQNVAGQNSPQQSAAGAGSQISQRDQLEQHTDKAAMPGRAHGAAGTAVRSDANTTVVAASAIGKPHQQSSAHELHFDHAFSSEEEDDSDHHQPQQQEQEADASETADSSAAIIIPAAGQDIEASSKNAERQQQQQQQLLYGTSPGSLHLLGSSPITTQLNSASTSGDFYMYQAADGQWLFLHPLNLRCLLHMYGSYAACPAIVTGKLLEMEGIVQDEASRRRWKFLSHLPLQGSFSLGEVEFLQPPVTPDQLAPFAEELSVRDRRRKRRAEAARRESRREAAAAAAAQKARQGPTAAELKAMPRLGSDCGQAGNSGVNIEIEGLTAGMTTEQLDEALAAQVVHDSAALGMSPPLGVVSFARIAQLGFAATGPALGGSGSSPAGGSSDSQGMAGEKGVTSGATAASPGVLQGAWGASTSTGQSAAARLSVQGSGSSKKGGNAATSSSNGSSLLGRSNWGGVSSAAAPPNKPTNGSVACASSTTSSNAWLVLGKEGNGSAASAADGARESGTAHDGAPATPSVAAGASSSGSGSSKKTKKGTILFATGQQRRY